MMRLVYFLVVVLITGCASTVEHLSDISPDDGRECYSYWTLSPEEVGEGVLQRTALMLFLGPLAGGLVGITSTDPEMRAPTKCGLTLEQAMAEAAVMSYFTKSRTIWKQKRAYDWVMITVQPTEKRSDCWASTLLIEKAVNDWPTKKYTRNINTCKNADGMPVIVKSD